MKASITSEAISGHAEFNKCPPAVLKYQEENNQQPKYSACLIVLFIREITY